MPYIHLPAPEFIGFIDAEAFDTLARCPDTTLADMAEFNRTLRDTLQPVTDQLNTDTIAILDGGSLLHAKKISSYNMFTSAREAEDFHSDLSSWTDARDIIIADEQGTEFISGQLYLDEIPPLAVLRSMLSEMLRTGSGLAAALTDPRNNLVIEQAMPYAVAVQSHNTYHRSPVNGKDIPVDRNLLIARYIFENVDLDSLDHEAEKLALGYKELVAI